MYQAQRLAFWNIKQQNQKNGQAKTHPLRQTFLYKEIRNTFPSCKDCRIANMGKIILATTHAHTHYVHKTYDIISNRVARALLQQSCIYVFFRHSKIFIFIQTGGDVLQPIVLMLLSMEALNTFRSFTQIC